MKSRIFWLLIWMGIWGMVVQHGSTVLAADTAQMMIAQTAIAHPPPPPPDGDNPQAKPPVTDGRLPERSLILAGSEATEAKAATALGTYL
jgi:hypothetical protein